MVFGLIVNNYTILSAGRRCKSDRWVRNIERCTLNVGRRQAGARPPECTFNAGKSQVQRLQVEG